MLEKQCECGKTFLVKKHRFDRSKYCSNSCKYKYRIRPSGLSYNIMNENPTWFKKGNKPWCAGTVGILKANSGSIKKGERRGIATEFKEKEKLAENNINWKGNDVGYFALHKWVQRQLGKATKCSKCGEENKRIDWANVSREYKREISDWMQLCSTCHGKYDSGHRGAIKRRFKK